MKTCIVTGGCGFIGSHLVEKLLSDNNKVVIIDDLSTGHIQNIKHLIKNKNLKLINKSILDPSIKKYFKKVEICIRTEKFGNSQSFQFYQAICLN